MSEFRGAHKKEKEKKMNKNFSSIITNANRLTLVKTDLTDTPPMHLPCIGQFDGDYLSVASDVRDLAYIYIFWLDLYIKRDPIVVQKWFCA